LPEERVRVQLQREPDVLDPGEEGGERVEDEAEEKTLYLTLPSIHSLESVSSQGEEQAES
jgi:hypothetical protein